MVLLLSLLHISLLLFLLLHSFLSYYFPPNVVNILLPLSYILLLQIVLLISQNLILVILQIQYEIHSLQIVLNFLLVLSILVFLMLGCYNLSCNVLLDHIYDRYFYSVYCIAFSSFVLLLKFSLVLFDYVVYYIDKANYFDIAYLLL